MPPAPSKPPKSRSAYADPAAVLCAEPSVTRIAPVEESRSTRQLVHAAVTTGISVCEPAAAAAGTCRRRLEPAAAACAGCDGLAAACRPSGVTASTMPITDLLISFGSQNAGSGPPGTRRCGTKNSGTLTRAARTAQRMASRA